MKLVRIIGFLLLSLNLTQLSAENLLTVYSEQDDQEITTEEVEEEKESESENQEKREDTDQ